MFQVTVTRTTTGECIYNDEFATIGKAYNRFAEWCDDYSYIIEETSDEGFTAGGRGFDYTIELKQIIQE
jgi:coproporphyrinogen III oxidase